jgi:glycosyltransferase involved in cell wall biosynthesis
LSKRFINADFIGPIGFFFQNGDEQELFVKTGLARAGVTDRLPGSGIDLARYTPMLKADRGGECMRFLLVARMLRYKGIGEYVEAARLVKKRFPKVQFQLLGFVDERNANGILHAEIKEWENEGVIQYLGDTDDVPRYLSNADCVVLPSFYREGVPRTLLEAAAMALPLITTNTVGCRDVVDDGINGFLCAPKDTNDLAEKMTRMIMVSPERHLEMGWAGRRKMEKEFDEKLVIQKYLDVIHDIFRSRIGDKSRGETAFAGRSRFD